MRIPTVDDGVLSAVTADGPEGPVIRDAIGFDPPPGSTGQTGPLQNNVGSGINFTEACTADSSGLPGDRAVLVTMTTSCEGTSWVPAADGTTWSVRSGDRRTTIAAGEMLDGCMAIVARGLSGYDVRSMLATTPSASPGGFASGLGSSGAVPAWVPLDLRDAWHVQRSPGSSIGWGLAGSDRYYSITAIVDTMSMAVYALDTATVPEDSPYTPAPDVQCETRGPNLLCARIDSPTKSTLSVYRNGIRLDVTESPTSTPPPRSRTRPSTTSLRWSDSPLWRTA